MNMGKANCDVCDSPMAHGLTDWHHVCTSCGFERSSLQPHINRDSAINEEEREAALRPIRNQNFNVMLNWLRTKVEATSPKMLEVGCAHGWFMEKARENFDVVGIEPDEGVASETIKKGLDVRVGFFPDVLHANDKFHLIVFNDVLEHIPDVRKVLELCRDKLNDGGYVVINAPDKNGIFYRLSKLLARVGFEASFERMWQRGLPSPHVYYFDTSSITTLAKAKGFSLIDRQELSTITAKGLFSRIHCSGDSSWLRSAVITGVTVALLPLLNVAPSDISVWLLRKA